jgi:hypothetical protein
MRHIGERLSAFVNRLAGFHKREGSVAVLRRSYCEAMAICDVPWLRFSWLLPGYTNVSEMRVFALRRSGHHAIVNWIRLQVRGRHCFLNDCSPNSNPFVTCRRGTSVIASPFVEHSYLFWNREASGKLSKKGVLIYNYEDTPFKDVVTDHFAANRHVWLGNSHKQHDIIILRDPFNLFASKLRWAYGSKSAPSLEQLIETVRMWKDYAREFRGDTNYLTDKVTINYNRWFLDRKYREDISRMLELPFNDKGLHIIARWGPTTWGDTFDGTRYDGNATAMKVLERWKHYRDDDFYVSLFRDQELLDLSESIFGHVPGTEILRRSARTIGGRAKA